MTGEIVSDMRKLYAGGAPDKSANPHEIRRFHFSALVTNTGDMTISGSGVLYRQWC
jgi:hypothetical protein